MEPKNDIRIAVIGLGYVGLPLAVAFGRLVPTLGYDINTSRVEELATGNDSTLEVSPEELAAAPYLLFASELALLDASNVYIVTVPTPVDSSNRPDLTPLLEASRAIGTLLSKGDTVIYESTVYPGATEEKCIPELEAASGLAFNTDFFVGYSPERINPGDKVRRLANVTKVTSGSTPETAEFVDRLYNLVVEAGTHRASSIRVAEASKVIENTQRDLNIALINELAIIFNRLGIPTDEVLEAAATKWNFLHYRPGLVGGHCIGVDPYYLTHKAQEIGYHPEVILAGRRINDGMGAYVASEVIKRMIQKRIHVQGANVLIMGFAFKENCPDTRNTRVIDMVCSFKEYTARVDVFDPWIHADDVRDEYGLTPIDAPVAGHYDAVIIAVAHDLFYEMGTETIRGFCRENHLLYDVKNIFPRHDVDGRL